IILSVWCLKRSGSQWFIDIKKCVDLYSDALKTGKAGSCSITATDEKDRSRVSRDSLVSRYQEHIFSHCLSNQ
ncbi:MAG: hypothetical protein ACI4NO_06520, partial [Oxalobacter sp.]